MIFKKTFYFILFSFMFNCNIKKNNDSNRLHSIVNKLNLKGVYLARVYNLNDSSLVIINEIKSSAILKDKLCFDYFHVNECDIFILDGYSFIENNIIFDNDDFIEKVKELEKTKKIFDEILLFEPKPYCFIMKKDTTYLDNETNKYLNYLPIAKLVNSVNFINNVQK